MMEKTCKADFGLSLKMKFTDFHYSTLQSALRISFEGSTMELLEDLLQSSLRKTLHVPLMGSLRKSLEVLLRDLAGGLK